MRNITTNYAVTYTNYTRVTQIKLPLRGRPILLITRMINYRPNWTPLIPITIILA